MSKTITGAQLREAVESETFIKGGDIKCAEGVKYDFRMGSRILKATFNQPIDMSRLSEAERKNMFVEPGEIVFVLTEERLELPNNMIAHLSPKRKLSHQGIMVLGGFCVDPLYAGRLLVGLYNFSSTHFPLIPGKKLIAALFYELEESELDEFPVPEAPIEDFPDELVRLIQSYKPIQLQGLQEALDETQRQLSDLRNELTSGIEWQQRFQNSLDRHDQQIDKLLKGLQDEMDNRRKAEEQFRGELLVIQRQTWKIAATLTPIVGIIAVVLTILARIFIPAIIKYFSAL